MEPRNQVRRCFQNRGAKNGVGPTAMADHGVKSLLVHELPQLVTGAEPRPGSTYANRTQKDRRGVGAGQFHREPPPEADCKMLREFGCRRPMPRQRDENGLDATKHVAGTDVKQIHVGRSKIEGRPVTVPLAAWPRSRRVRTPPPRACRRSTARTRSNTRRTGCPACRCR